jgi:hypothetical protein
MVRDHVHVDVHGHDHAPELDGRGFGKFRVATILKDGQTCCSSGSACNTHTCNTSPGNAERGDACSNCSECPNCSSHESVSSDAGSNHAVKVTLDPSRYLFIFISFCL